MHLYITRTFDIIGDETERVIVDDFCLFIKTAFNFSIVIFLKYM